MVETVSGQQQKILSVLITLFLIISQFSTCLVFIFSDYRISQEKEIQESCSSAIKIMVTAYGNETVISEAKRAGTQEIIEKPFSTKTIEAALNKLIIQC